MEFGKFLCFLLVIGPGFSKHLGSWEQSDESVPELSWIFDIEETKDNVVEKKEAAVCQTKECKIIADEFLRGMNKSVDPCENFYDYMCGEWKKQITIPPYESSWSRFSMFQATVYRRIKGILETNPEPSDILPVRQAKKWFRSCMDTETLNKRGLSPLESILVQIGGWPMTLDSEEWDESEQSWQGVEDHYFHITGSHTFYEITPGWSRDDSILLGRGTLPLSELLPAKYRNDTENAYETYEEIIEAIVLMFIEHNKADVSKEKLKQDVENLVEFEKQLNVLDDTHNNYEEINMTIDDFIEWYRTNITEIEDTEKVEKLDFRHVIRRTFDMVNYDIEDSTPLTLDGSSSYWIELTKLLSETPKRTIVNYIHWRFVSHMLPYTTEEIRDLIFLLAENEMNLKERRPRWLECAMEIQMTSAASYAFVQKYFSNETEQAVRNIIDNVREEMKSQMEKSHWMDAETKELTIKKLNTMKAIVGFPEWYKNKTIVQNVYKGLTIGTEYFDNILSYEKFQIKMRLRELFNSEEFVDLTMDTDATVVNAFYAHGANFIELPAADFQPPLFTTKLPRSVNYGIAGLIIGHEIGHGFDSHGFADGFDGNKTEMSKQIIEMYYKRAECFLSQFNQYYGVTEADYDETTPESYKDLSPGRRTRAENIADSTGLHSVYEAYRKMIEQTPGGDYKLPGFEGFTDDQMFFVSFGAMWCEALTPKFEEMRGKRDNHSPSRLRVIGAVSNTNDFARVFNCPKGSAMNPENKCDIWDAPEPHADVEVKPKKWSRNMKKHHKWEMNW